MNQGSGEARLAVDGRDRQGRLRVGKLSDGEWHRLDIFINGQVFHSHTDNLTDVVNVDRMTELHSL